MLDLIKKTKNGFRFDGFRAPPHRGAGPVREGAVGGAQPAESEGRMDREAGQEEEVVGYPGSRAQRRDRPGGPI